MSKIMTGIRVLRLSKTVQKLGLNPNQIPTFMYGAMADAIKDGSNVVGHFLFYDYAYDYAAKRPASGLAHPPTNNVEGCALDRRRSRKT